MNPNPAHDLAFWQKLQRKYRRSKDYIFFCSTQQTFFKLWDNDTDFRTTVQRFADEFMQEHYTVDHRYPHVKGALCELFIYDRYPDVSYRTRRPIRLHFLRWIIVKLS